jgi:CBS domain-containing protein
MTVAAILQMKGSDIVSVTSDTPVSEVVALLSAKRIGAVPVIDSGRLAGIFSERDVVHWLAAEGAGVLDRPVRDVMTSPAVTVERSTSVLAALALVTRRRIRHLPVVDGEALVGIVSIGDLVKLRIDRIEAEAEAMRDYIAGH